MRHKKEIFVLLALAVVATVANQNTSSTTNTGCCGQLVLTPAKRNVTEFLACNHDCIQEVYIVGLDCVVHKPLNQKSWSTVHVKMENMKKVNGRFVLSVLAQCDFDFPNLAEIKGPVATVEFIDGSKPDFLSGLKTIHTEDEACRSTSSIREVTGQAAIAISKFDAAVKDGIQQCKKKNPGAVSGSKNPASGGNSAGSSPGAQYAAQASYECGDNIIPIIILSLVIAILLIPAIGCIIQVIYCKFSKKEDGEKKKPFLKTPHILLSRWCYKNIERGATKNGEEFDATDYKTYKVPQHDGDKGAFRHAIPCAERTRVVLQEDKFIHANYINVPGKSNRFIGTQGPKVDTISAFWMMVVQEKAEVIVMLCNFIEGNSDGQKCAEYYPAAPGTSQEFDYNKKKIKVTCLASSTFIFRSKTSVQIGVTDFSVTLDKEPPRNLRHYQWKDWPDHGPPPVDNAMIELLDVLDKIETPIVVHCSAGVGRTGCLIMAEYIYRQIKLNQPIDEPLAVVKKIRNMRSQLVQTRKQYLYVIQLFMNYYTEHHENRVNEEMENYRRDFEKI